MGAYFSISSLFFIIIFIIYFYSKAHIKNIDTKIYGSLLIITFVGILIDIISYLLFINNFNYNSIFFHILAKTESFYYIVWITIFGFYIYASVNNYKNKNYLNSINRLKLIIKIIILILTIIYFCMLFMPIYFIQTDNLIVPHGLSIDITYFFVTVAFIIIVLIALKNIKIIINKKYIPLLALIVSIVIIIEVQSVRPDLFLLNFCLSLIDTILYFTIENPDVKMLNEVTLAKNQVEKSNKAKSEFISSMSHEIRTPLNAIMGYSQMIDFAENLDEAKENSKEIVNASNTLLNMLSNILDISMVEVNELELKEVNYNLKELVQEVTSLFKYKIEEKNLKFNIKISKLPNTLIGDPDKIKRILANLLDNAIKYTNKGKINLIINNEIKGNNCLLEIIVEDTGKGIDKETKKHLFDNFNRAEEHMDSHISGMGLGLSITKSLVEMMNGKISYDSVVNKGTKFIVNLNQKVGSKK